MTPGHADTGVIDPHTGALIVLGCLFVLIMLARVQALDDREQLALEHRRRLEAEAKVRGHDGQIDGALETISRLQARVDELAPESGDG